MKYPSCVASETSASARISDGSSLCIRPPSISLSQNVLTFTPMHIPWGLRSCVKTRCFWSSTDVSVPPDCYTVYFNWAGLCFWVGLQLVGLNSKLNPAMPAQKCGWWGLPHTDSKIIHCVWDSSTPDHPSSGQSRWMKRKATGNTRNQARLWSKLIPTDKTEPKVTFCGQHLYWTPELIAVRIRHRCKEPYRVNNTENSSFNLNFQMQNVAI